MILRKKRQTNQEIFIGMTNRGLETHVRKHFPDKTFEAIIPRSIRLAEAPSYGLPIIEYNPSSPGAIAYNELAKEILEEDGVPLAV